MTALVLAQIPNPHITSSITADQFSLVRVNNDIVYWHAVGVISLNVATSSVPNLDGSIFRTSDEPFRFAVKCYAGNVGCVSVESQDRIGVRRFDIVKLDSMVSCGGKVSFVR